MTSQEYLRSSVLGAGWPSAISGGQQRQSSTRARPNLTDVSSLLELERLQIPEPSLEQIGRKSTRSSFLDEPVEETLARLTPSVTHVDWSLADFERDLDLIAEGLQDLRLEYHGSYSRDDIYRDDD